MSRLRRRLAALYALGALVAAGALVVVTKVVLTQQREHARTVAQALHHEDLRIALWRMETRVGTLLATATARSPALLDTANSVRYLQNGWIDPELAVVNPLAPPDAALEERLLCAADDAFEASRSAEACGLFAPEEAAEPLAQELSQRGVERSRQEYQWRAGANNVNRLQVANVAAEPGLTTCIGPLAPVWDSEGDELRLHLSRRVEAPQGVLHENFRLSWEELEATLVAEIRDLFPTARLVPVAEDATPDDDAARLAAIPACLEVPPPRPATDLPRGYRWTLGGAWAATLLALVSGAFALRASLAYGDKHRRFTQAVTHELRTPLTTFRMYSEMLARGMVPEEARAEYLATLEQESGRLSGLVENVLRYARLEEDRAGPPLEVLGAAALLERCVPELARRCASAGAKLEVSSELEDGVLVRTDPEAVLQVLANLVDNACKYGACKYGCPGSEPTVTLRAARAGARVAFEVSDEGPGVPAAVARAIFQPFERGGRDSSDPAPGVGLGLALARALARELRGELALVPGGRGATFALRLPAVT